MQTRSSGDRCARPFRDRRFRAFGIIRHRTQHHRPVAACLAQLICHLARLIRPPAGKHDPEPCPIDHIRSQRNQKVELFQNRISHHDHDLCFQTAQILCVATAVNKQVGAVWGRRQRQLLQSPAHFLWPFRSDDSSNPVGKLATRRPDRIFGHLVSGSRSKAHQIRSSRRQPVALPQHTARQVGFQQHARISPLRRANGGQGGHARRASQRAEHDIHAARSSLGTSPNRMLPLAMADTTCVCICSDTRKATNKLAPAPSDRRVTSRTST